MNVFRFFLRRSLFLPHNRMQVDWKDIGYSPVFQQTAVYTQTIGEDRKQEPMKNTIWKENVMKTQTRENKKPGGYRREKDRVGRKTTEERGGKELKQRKATTNSGNGRGTDTATEWRKTNGGERELMDF